MSVMLREPPVPGTGGIAGLVAGSTNSQYAGGVASTCYAGVATPVSRNVALFAGEQTVVDSVDNVSHVAQTSCARHRRYSRSRGRLY